MVDREGGTLIVTTVSDIDDEHRAKERQIRIKRIEASEKRYLSLLPPIYYYFLKMHCFLNIPFVVSFLLMLIFQIPATIRSYSSRMYY